MRLPAVRRQMRLRRLYLHRPSFPPHPLPEQPENMKSGKWLHAAVLAVGFDIIEPKGSEPMSFFTEEFTEKFVLFIGKGAKTEKEIRHAFPGIVLPYGHIDADTGENYDLIYPVNRSEYPNQDLQFKLNTKGLNILYRVQKEQRAETLAAERFRQTMASNNRIERLTRWTLFLSLVSIIATIAITVLPALPNWMQAIPKW